MPGVLNMAIDVLQTQLREGDPVRVVLTNKLSQSTAIHFHGLELPNDQDGVPFIPQPPVKPGDSYTYEFTVPNAGSHMYHSHHNAAVQVGNGLLGAFIVEPRTVLKAHRADLTVYLDTNSAFLRAFGAYGLPLSVLIDPEGREMARAVGAVRWDAPESIAYFKSLGRPARAAS